jgi:rare lipoprotein A (peptidoglycan hydrolase)
MIMSLVLSVPVLSSQAMAATDSAPVSSTQRLASPRKAVKAPVSKSLNRPAAVKTASVRATEQRVQTRWTGRTRVLHSNGASNDRTVYRTSSHTDALIDDGTLWRETGSSATWQQTGVASWYGGAHWQGHRTTSGARYDQNELTAAHATLPIGTRVRVTLNDNSARFVIVTINDRPGTRSRIIDLSRQAAAELGILQRGTAMVTLTPL